MAVIAVVLTGCSWTQAEWDQFSNGMAAGGAGLKSQGAALQQHQQSPKPKDPSEGQYCSKTLSCPYGYVCVIDSMGSSGRCVSRN